MPQDYRSLVAGAKAQIREIACDDLAGRLDAVQAIIDVREPEEHAQGIIPGAHLVPRGILESSIAAKCPDPATEMVLYCAVGARSALAAKALQEMGYGNVSSLEGGFAAWKASGREWRTPGGLTADQRARYSRHVLLPEIGESGQERLLDAKVMLLGAGGLGSPAAMYLAAAGVGTLGIVDFDTVDLSNLQRQILHNLEQVGRLKVDSATETLRALNPDVKIEPYAERLTAANAVDLMSGYDVVIDGADNFPTRYLVNDASMHTRTPVVHGSIFRFEGQATVFAPYGGPCYRCLFPLPPPAELAPSCAEAGVLGVLPGIIGSIQALEAIKLVLGIGETLVGRLLTYDALDESFQTLNLRRDPGCPACGDEASPPPLVDYDDACAPA